MKQTAQVANQPGSLKNGRMNVAGALSGLLSVPNKLQHWHETEPHQFESHTRLSVLKAIVTAGTFVIYEHNQHPALGNIGRIVECTVDCSAIPPRDINPHDGTVLREGCSYVKLNLFLPMSVLAPGTPRYNDSRLRGVDEVVQTKFFRWVPEDTVRDVAFVYKMSSLEDLKNEYSICKQIYSNIVHFSYMSLILI